jgi:phosphonate transport system substrate-binding protein
METLKIASCMAENTETLCQSIAQYMQLRLNIRTEYVTGIPWQERERRFDQGEIQILWLCGWPYVEKTAHADSNLEMLVVPVPAGVRYQGRPVYFSDVVVRRDSRFKSFADLRGAAWAYNEPRSHSGYNVVRAYLAGLGYRNGFFGAVVESGAHAQSVEMILGGAVDGAAIDATVLEWLVDQREELTEQIRVIDTLGPSPIPPWVISTQVAIELRSAIRELFLTMHMDRLGRDMLNRGRLEKFVAGSDREYDPIRRMARAAEQVLLV